jgi:hypothetical protein
MLSADRIVELHDQLIRDWHLDASQESHDTNEGSPSKVDKPAGHGTNENASPDWPSCVAKHQRANFDLWHIEDQARVPGASDSELARVKRRVDMINQRRNDLAEELDRVLLGWLSIRNLPNPEAPLHSESPGLMIDRLSILALKIYHTREEAERAAAPPGHTERNQERLTILEEQRADLAGCLEALWQQTLAGARRFKLYRQLKMYNDPTLNPAIYQKSLQYPKS